MTGSVHWHHQFARGSHLDVALNRYVAVVEPIGRYVVIDTTDGSVLVDQKFAPLPHIRDVHLYRGPATLWSPLVWRPCNDKQPHPAELHGHDGFCSV